MKFFKLLGYGLVFSSILVLSGCGTASGPVTKISVTPQDTSAETPANPLENITTQSDSPEVLDTALLDDPAGTIHTFTDVQTLLSEFKLKDRPQFIGCAHNVISDCQTQVSTQAALTEKNANLCDNISNKDQVVNCKNQLWTQLANLEGQVELCNKISEDYAKISCQDQYWRDAAGKEINAELCQKINETYLKEECSNQILMQAAVEAKDPELCKKIKLYDYLPVDPIAPETSDEDLAAAEVAEPERVELPDEQNYLLQDCRQQVQSAKEMAEIEAAAAAEADAQEKALAEAEALAAEEAEAEDATTE